MHSRCHERWTFMVNHCESHMPYRTFAIAGGGGGGAQAPACAGEGHACAAPVVLGPRAAEEAAASGGGHVFSSSFDLYACTIFISFTFLWHPFACKFMASGPAAGATAGATASAQTRSDEQR